MVSAGKLRRTDLKKIEEIHPNILLLAGGVDYGERDTALENAEKIAALGTTIPVIYAGNVENQEEIQLIFDETDQELFIVENVYPKIDELNIDPTRKVIQDAFEKHITHAPGMEHIYDMVNGKISPTPGSVMNLTQVLYKYIGDVMVVDVGGATTDVHSVTEGTQAIAEISVAPEPKAKRTVEGDIGLYVNIDHVVELYGEDRLAQEGVDLAAIRKSYTGIPQSDAERDFAEKLSKIATQTAVDRHVGQIRYVYGPTGRGTLAQGKDLSNIKYIIGTGGALTRLSNGEEILKTLIKRDEQNQKLLPDGDVTVLLDHDYIMASLGVLALKYEEASMKLLEKSLGMDIL